MKLKDIRAQRFLTRKELASKAGVGASTVYAIESGCETPTLPSARKIAQALEIGPMEVDEFKAAYQRAFEDVEREG